MSYRNSSKPLPRKTSVKANRDHKVVNRVSRRPVRELSTDQKRLAAYELRIEAHSIPDIAKALGVSVSRASQYIEEAGRANDEERQRLAPQVLQLELDRTDRIILAWYPRARKALSKGANKAADVLLKWLERKDKLLGLYVNRNEWSGPGGGPIQITASHLDLTKLNDEELGWLEVIVRKAGPNTALPSAEELPALEHDDTSPSDEASEAL
jgi:hypothetical protein